MKALIRSVTSAACCLLPLPLLTLNTNAADPAQELASFKVAEGFEPFLYRFWIENLAWFLTVDQDAQWEDLPAPVAGYLAHYRSGE